MPHIAIWVWTLHSCIDSYLDIGHHFSQAQAVTQTLWILSSELAFTIASRVAWTCCLKSVSGVSSWHSNLYSQTLSFNCNLEVISSPYIHHRWFVWSVNGVTICFWKYICMPKMLSSICTFQSVHTDSCVLCRDKLLAEMLFLLPRKGRNLFFLLTFLTSQILDMLKTWNSLKLGTGKPNIIIKNPECASCTRLMRTWAP